jgi:hypothetical protein
VSAIIIRANDDALLRIKVPRGLKRRHVLRALDAINRGGDYQGCTEAEAAFVAEVVERIQQHNAGAGS